MFTNKTYCLLKFIVREREKKTGMNKYGLTSDQLNSIISNVQDYNIPIGEKTREISIAKVCGRTYMGDKVGHPFNHWAILVGKYYYYLTFDFGIEGRYGNPGGVFFARDLKENIQEMEQDTPLGVTSCQCEDIMLFGAFLINRFKDQYQLFWNCHHFIDILLKRLTGDFDLTTSVVLPSGCLFRFRPGLRRVSSGTNPEFKEILATMGSDQVSQTSGLLCTIQ